ncbi:hypothetical protein HN51_011847 [Arachis hypogaea]
MQRPQRNVADQRRLGPIDRYDAVHAMLRYADASLSTFHMADHCENNLFDHLFELLNSSTHNDESFARELASCTGALQTSVSQHMAKEEEQLSEIAVETRKKQSSGDFTNLSSFNQRLQFIAEVCMFHSFAEDKVIFPAVDGELSFFQEHAEEEEASLMTSGV